MSIYGSGLVFTGARSVFDPNTGDELEMTYRGSESLIVAQAVALRAAGWRCDVEQSDTGGWSLAVRQPGQNSAGTPEVPSDKWQIKTDYSQESLWNNKKIWDAVDVESSANGDTSIITEWLGFIRSDCELALKGWKRTGLPTLDPGIEIRKGPLLPSETGFATTSLKFKIYQQMIAGMESFESERIVAQRVRTFSINYASRMSLPEVPYVLTPSTFISRYAIPTSVSSKFPTAPTAKIPNTVWAWKQRSHVSDINWYGKVTETIEWTFAAWSTLQYDVDP